MMNPTLAVASPLPDDANGAVDVGLQDDADLFEIETRFTAFAHAHTVGPDPAAAMREGRFSALPGQEAADLFGAADMAFSLHILGQLDAVSDREGRGRWIDFILTFQDDDGWFRSRDKQKHSVTHASAYAMAALQILAAGDGGHRERIAERLKPFRGLTAQIAARPGRGVAPFALSLLDRVHFWRGSHRAGGIAAIIGAAHELDLSSQQLFEIGDAKGWLDGWWAYYAARVEPATGYWRLAPRPLQMGFDRLYRSRHDPELAAMAGAVHLYWVAWRLGKGFPYPAATTTATARLLGESGLWEHEPYCIDLDGNFMVARPLAQIAPDDPLQARGRQVLQRNRDAVVRWYTSRPPQAWNPNTHKLPGAFAAVAEADRLLTGAGRWHDVFKTTWWL